MLYIVVKTYVPNTASINRIMGWVRGFSECEIATNVMFFSPSANFDKIQSEFRHIRFIYMWEKFYFKNSILKFVSLLYYILSFLLQLKKGDVVLLYACPDILKWVVKRKGIYIYEEITEHPEVSLRTSRFSKLSASKFIQICKKIDGLFVISQNLKDYLVSQGLAVNKIHLVNMTVDAERFVGLSQQTEERYIAYCGNASNNKDGVDQLIKAFAITNQSYPQMKLFIIGPKPDQGQPFPNFDLVKELGIEQNVVFTGTVAAENIPQMLKNAEICALDRPNNKQAQYGFPTKLGEYLLTENPVVLTRVGNIPDFLEDKDSVLFADPENPQSFADQLNWCIEHPKEAQEIGKRGAEVASEKFNYLVETKKIINVILSK